MAATKKNPKPPPPPKNKLRESLRGKVEVIATMPNREHPSRGGKGRGEKIRSVRESEKSARKKENLTVKNGCGFTGLCQRKSLKRKDWSGRPTENKRKWRNL